MQQFAEFKEITAAEDPWMDNIQGQAGKILDNAFIQDCDIQGIKGMKTCWGLCQILRQGLKKENRLSLCI